LTVKKIDETIVKVEYKTRSVIPRWAVRPSTKEPTHSPIDPEKNVKLFLRVKRNALKLINT
jgi:hypothetical protein